MKKSAVCLLLLLLCAISFLAGRSCSSDVTIPNSEPVVVDSTTTETVMPDTAPVVRDSVVVRYEYEKIPITPPPKDTTEAVYTHPETIEVTVNGDSAEVVIPITQKEYKTEDYRAYVSGYRATLDSIFINRTTTTIRIREPTKQKRFSVGLQAGYGMTPKGFQPYIGLGIAVNLWSF